MEEFKREEKNIFEMKAVEKRMNLFNFEFNEDRNKNGIDRNIKCSTLKVLNNKFKSKKLIIFLNNNFLANVCKLTDSTSYKKK